MMLALRHIEDVMRPDIRAFLQAEALPAYLRHRRWFASKDRPIAAVHLVRADKFPMAAGMISLAEIDVRLADRTERYQLPIGLVWDDEQTSPLIEQLAIVRVADAGRRGYLTDAFALDSLPLGLLAALRDQLLVVFADAKIRCSSTAALRNMALPAHPRIHRIAVEQSNSSVVLGDEVIVKIIRRVMGGINPEVEMVRHLTEHGYANTPPLLGEVARVTADGTPHSMMVAQRFVANQGDAWHHTLGFLKTNADRRQAYAPFAAVMGTRLGELHEVLARPSGDPAFSPVVADAADTAAWAQEAHRQLAAAFETLRHLPDPPPAIARDAAFVAVHGPAILRALPALAAAGTGCLKTRIHGDFHLGQVLVAAGDAYIIDFEGEPSKSLATRRAKSSPLRDVAGLLRSFSYAAAAGVAGGDFVGEMSAVFLNAYRAAAPAPGGDQAALLELFLLEKSAYEICYEAANRPAWLGIPLRGFVAIAARVLNLSPETTDA
jgi:maltose alpha-D-glucosyltransferase/alpha-amylase